MTKNALYKLPIAIGLCFMILGISFQTSFAQPEASSTFELGKQKAQKKPIPGEGSIKGAVVVQGKKKKVPLAFIDVEGGRSIQADLKGKFDLVLGQGTYKINIKCSGYKDLTIESIPVKDGNDQYVTINLALKEKGDFK